MYFTFLVVVEESEKNYAREKNKIIVHLRSIVFVELMLLFLANSTRWNRVWDL